MNYDKQSLMCADKKVAFCRKLCLWSWWFPLQLDLEETKYQTVSWPLKTIGVTKVTANHDWFEGGMTSSPSSESWKKKKEGTETGGLLPFNYWTLFIILKHVLFEGNGCGAVPAISLVWRGRGREKGTTAYGMTTGTRHNSNCAVGVTSFDWQNSPVGTHFSIEAQRVEGLACGHRANYWPSPLGLTICKMGTVMPSLSIS